MGISPFSSCSAYPDESSVVAPNPDPINFRILELDQIGSVVVAKIKYPDCTNFEGIKICVFENTTIDVIRGLKALDPHFSNSDLSPVARFKPTSHGIKLADMLAQILNIKGDK